MAAAFFGRRHIVIDLLDLLVGARATAVLIHLADALGGRLPGIAGLGDAALPAGQAYAYGDVKLELGLPIYVLWSSRPSAWRNHVLRVGDAAAAGNR
jgi:hypothetical protein